MYANWKGFNVNINSICMLTETFITNEHIKFFELLYSDTKRSDWVEKQYHKVINAL